MTTTLKSYVCDAWHDGAAPCRNLHNPTTGAVIAHASTQGIDMGAALAHARAVGGPSLRTLTFAERGACLEAAAKVIHEHREALIDLALENGGNTRKDAKFDIDGASGTLAYYGRQGQKLGDARFLLDGGETRLSANPRYVGRHIRVPLTGCAVHINAFNFPAWGMCEKLAVAVLAGVPVVSKPATSTAVVAARIAELFVEASVFPTGAFSTLVGSVGDLLDHLTSQDMVAFTGSSDTARAIAGHPNVLARNVRVNLEADSDNAAILGPDADPASPTWDLFIREVAVDMTQKAGQKCTAIRRIFVPTALMDDVRRDLAEELGRSATGDPADKGTTVGPLATASQQRDIRAGLDRLGAAATVAYEGEAPGDAGYFVAPTLLEVADGHAADAVHAHEVFGPVATLIPFDGTAADAVALVRRGDGGLVASVYSDDTGFLSEMVFGIAPFHGRIHLASKKVAEHSPGPGTVLPQMQHGGPGRAGGGAELGGLRGLEFYTQRTAVQGLSPLLQKLFADGVEA